MTMWIGGSRRWAVLVGILLLSACLLFFDLGSKSLWIDEYNNIQIASRADLGAVTQGVVEGFQRQPPAYFWLLHVWTRLVGNSEAAARSLSVLMGLASVLLTFVLVRQVLDADVGLVAAYLLAVSPTFVMYARMARYYLPTLLLGLLSCCLFLWLISARPGRNTRIGWAVYALTNVALLLSSYVAGAVLLCQVVYAVLYAPRNRVQVVPWLISMTVALAIAAGWFVYALSYINQYPLAPADFAAGLSSYLVKLAYPIYSFTVGETLFPWRWPAIVGLSAAGILSLISVWWLRSRPVHLAFLLTGFGASILVVVMSTTWFVVDVPFLNIPSRSIFAAPFLYALVAVGVCVLPSPVLKLFAVAALTVCSSFGLVNYYRGLEFHNPIYAVPSREVVAEVRSALLPGDVIVNESDSGFAYYYPRTEQHAPLWDHDKALPLLQAQRPPRVWFITFGRDATRGVTDVNLVEWLQTNYHLAAEKGYVEQDPLYQRVKEVLLHRPAYRYKLLVQRYEKPSQ